MAFLRLPTGVVLGPLLIVLVEATARADDGDIADAVRFASPFLGDAAMDGLEDFVDVDPDEALSLLLARDIIPGQAPEEYDENGPSAGHVLETLGTTRLNYELVRTHLEEAAQETGLPIGLIDAVIRTESGYRPKAVSRAGAVGLMQLLPATGRAMGVRDLFNPRENILGGARYLRQMLDQFGTLRLALAAYNAGPAIVVKYGRVPPFQETMRYVETVLGRYRASRYLKRREAAPEPR